MTITCQLAMECARSVVRTVDEALGSNSRGSLVLCAVFIMFQWVELLLGRAHAQEQTAAITLAPAKHTVGYRVLQVPATRVPPFQLSKIGVGGVVVVVDAARETTPATPAVVIASAAVSFALRSSTPLW